MSFFTNRRHMLLGLVSATTAAATGAMATGAATCVAPNPTPAHDPLPEWWEQFKLATKELGDASYKPGNGDFDTAEMLEIDARRDGLEKAIIETAPKTQEGAIAQLALIKHELNEGFVCSNHIPMIDRMVVALRGMA